MTTLSDVRVPHGYVVDRSLGEAGLLPAQFAGNQLIHAAIEAGSAIGALEPAAPWLGNAEAAGAPASAVRLGRLGDLAAEAEAVRALGRRAARLVDAALKDPVPGTGAPLAVIIAVDEAKVLACNLGPEVAGELIDFFPPGVGAAQLRFDRFWHNTRTHSLHDPVR